jgi:hypothetical protein
MFFEKKMHFPRENGRIKLWLNCFEKLMVPSESDPRELSYVIHNLKCFELFLCPALGDRSHSQSLKSSFSKKHYSFFWQKDRLSLVKETPGQGQGQGLQLMGIPLIWLGQKVPQNTLYNMIHHTSMLLFLYKIVFNEIWKANILAHEIWHPSPMWK